jgi:small nuclear ribonucleoprotein G
MIHLRRILYCDVICCIVSHFKLLLKLELCKDKRLKLSLNANRKIIGTLRGYDAFLNVVLEDAESETGQYLGQIVIRGNSIVQLEGLERL